MGVEHLRCSQFNQSIYLFKYRENTGNSFRNWQQKTFPSLFHSLTLAELPASSGLLFRALVSMVLTRGLVCHCLCLCEANTSFSVAVIVICHCNMELMVLNPLPLCSQHKSLLRILFMASSMGLSTCSNASVPDMFS